jgi:SulP family sulfate permease
MLRPKLVTTLRNYSFRQFGADLFAGLIVGVVALPLAIAFAIASGLPPERGLYTAIVGGFIISALGGSRVQIGGPTGAFVVIVYQIVQTHGYEGLIVASIMAGILLVVLGVARLGAAIKFIPYPLIVGFTSGIALIIFSTQLKDLLGLRIAALSADFLEQWHVYWLHLPAFNPYALAIGGLSIGIIIVWQKYIRRVPGSLVALIVATLLVYFFELPVETIGSRFGELPRTLPAPHLPAVDLATIRELIQPAVTLALLGGIESLLSAVVADGMMGGKHRSNMELVAQGVANVAAPIFGGMPATGAIARTAANIKNGGRTPIAGIVHALTLLLILLLFGPVAKLIPLPCLAAVLIVVAYNMSEWRMFLSLLKSPRSDVAVLLTVFLLTVLVDLTVAIETGIVLAVFLFMARMSAVTNVGNISRELTDEEETDDPLSIDKRKVPPGVEVYEVNGPFFFGAAYKFEEALREFERQPRILVIRMRNVPAIDSTGIHALRQVRQRCRDKGTVLLISGLHTQPLFAIQKVGFFEEIGAENILGDVDLALARAREILDGT